MMLLVEDEEAVSSGIAALLAFEGIEVDVVTTGAAAIEYLKTKTPDAMMLDFGLPDMGGTEVYRAVVATHPDLPVIFSTGHADRSSLDELAQGRPVFYLLKPFDAEALLATIRSALQR